MIGPIGITLRQAEDHFDFIMDLTESQHVCWKIVRPDGKSAMMVPVNEILLLQMKFNSRQKNLEKNSWRKMRPETRKSMEMLFHAKWNLPKAAEHANLSNKENENYFQ